MTVTCRCLLLGCIVLWGVGETTFANAAADVPPTDQQPVPARKASEQTPEDSPSKAELLKQQRRRTVTAALYVLGGILFVGLMLIALTMLWGIRTRRIVRKPLPEQSPGDPLWYLRPDKQAGAPDVASPDDAAEEADPEQDADETI